MKKQNKGMSSWIWILIIIVLIAAVALVYILFSTEHSGIFGGPQIPQPPPLPS